MKLSELDPSKHLKVLAYGEAGSGKTVFAAGFPTPMFVADFDNKISSAAAYYNSVGRGDQLEKIEYENYTNLSEIDEPFNRWSRKVHDFEKQVKEGTFDTETIVIDSLTFYADRMMEKVIKDCPGIKGPIAGDTTVPGLQHYGVINPHFKAQLARVLALPCNVVVTAHIKMDKDDLSGEIIRGPMLSPKLAGHLPILFPEVYRTYVENKNGAVKYYAQTVGDFRYKVIRSQIPKLPSPVELRYENLATPLAALK